MSNPTYKITQFQNVPFAGSCKLVDNSLTTSTNNTITFPSENATLATTADITNLSNTYLTQTDASTTYATQTSLGALNTKFNNLLDYLEAWVSAGNLSMTDIKEAVNGSD